VHNIVRDDFRRSRSAVLPGNHVKFLFDLFPVILFFVAYKFGHSNPAEATALASRYLGVFVGDGNVPAAQAPILIATAVAIVASLAQVGWLMLRRRKVDAMLWISVAVIIVFGGATIWLHDETFIKWKPTILYAVFALILAAGKFGWQRNFIRTLLGQQIVLGTVHWDRLLWTWVTFFVALAVLNLWVAFTFPTDTWVNFKLFGLMGITLAFALGVGIWMARHVKEDAPDA
jgi:intracellular septation protein